MTAPLLPLLECPHCASVLGVSSRTPEGEIARCGNCWAPVVLEHGRLVVPVAPPALPPAAPLETP